MGCTVTFAWASHTAHPCIETVLETCDTPRRTRLFLERHGGSALPLRKRQEKVPLNTYVRPGAHQRVEVLKDRGYAVTDIVDAALNEFLDRAGVPQAE